MAAVDNELERDVEQGFGMDANSGDRGYKEKKNKEGVIQFFVKLLTLVGLYMFSADHENLERRRRENKYIWTVAIPVLSCNSAVITNTPPTNGGSAQAALILAVLSSVLALILIVAPIAMPARSMLKVKRLVVTLAVFLTGCSFLAYVANRMGPMAPPSVAAISASGFFVVIITCLFLWQTISSARRPSIPLHYEPPFAPHPTPGYCQSPLASAPPPARLCPAALVENELPALSESEFISSC